MAAPGRMTTRLVPSLAISLRTASLAPWPTATMAINAATPMKTPSIVSADRILLRQIACAAAVSIIQANAQTRPDRSRERCVLTSDGKQVALGASGSGDRRSRSAPARRRFSSEMIWPSRMVRTRSA